MREREPAENAVCRRTQFLFTACFCLFPEVCENSKEKRKKKSEKFGRGE